MHRKQRSLAPSSLDDTFPSPLTSRNLRPRSEARSLRSTSSSRGGSRSSSSSHSSSLIMPPKRAVARASSRGIKRERSGSVPDSGRKRARAARRTVKRERSESDSAEEGREVDELQDDVETILLPSDIQASNRTHAEDNLPSGPSSSHIHPPKSPPSSGSAVGSGSQPIIINSPTEFTIASGSNLQRSVPSPSPTPASRPEPEPLSSYSCPICFFPPTNATLTPCGHICCGSCLFTAVKTMTQRGAMMPEASVARSVSSILLFLFPILIIPSGVQSAVRKFQDGTGEVVA